MFYILFKKRPGKIIGILCIDCIKGNDSFFIGILHPFCHLPVCFIIHNIGKWFAERSQNIVFYCSPISERICFLGIRIHDLLQAVFILIKVVIIGCGNGLISSRRYGNILSGYLFKITFRNKNGCHFFITVNFNISACLFIKIFGIVRHNKISCRMFRKISHCNAIRRGSIVNFFFSDLIFKNRIMK